jgi:membrane-associated phospholipid phosphatase
VTARTVNALLALGACVASLVALYLAAFVVPVTEHADQRVFDAFLSLRTYRTGTLAGYVIGFFNLGPYALAVLALTVAALALGERRKAAAVVAICAGANITTQVLKLVTAAPRGSFSVDDVSWPSGHLTAATSLALCVVLVVPPMLRTYAAGAGVLGVLATAYSILIAGSHHPTDVVAGMLMAGAWTAVGVAGLDAAERRWPSGRPAPGFGASRRTLWLASGAAAASVFAALVLGAAASSVGIYPSDHAALLAGAVLLAACAAILPAAAAMLLDPAVRRR